MTRFANQGFAAVLAVLISAVSLQAVVTVPPAQAQTQIQTQQMVELA